MSPSRVALQGSFTTKQTNFIEIVTLIRWGENGEGSQAVVYSFQIKRRIRANKWIQQLEVSTRS